MHQSEGDHMFFMDPESDLMVDCVKQNCGPALVSPGSWHQAIQHSRSVGTLEKASSLGANKALGKDSSNTSKESEVDK